MSQRVPVHPLHRDVDHTALLTELVDLDHVRMACPRRDSRLIDEHPLELGIACEVRQDRLDRHQLREPALPVEPRGPYARHAPHRNRNE